MICISFGNSLQNYWLVLRTREYLVARVNTSPVEFLDWMRKDWAQWRRFLAASRFQPYARSPKISL